MGPLIASFSSTLEDALYADQLLHVVDYSNPDWEHQMSQVLGTLRRLKVPAEAIQKMVTVGNKIDKLPHRQWVAIKENGSLPISNERLWVRTPSGDIGREAHNRVRQVESGNESETRWGGVGMVVQK